MPQLIASSSQTCCTVPCDGIQSTPSAQSSSFTFSWQIIWPGENWKREEDSLSLCVCVLKFWKKITCSFNKITEVTEDQWLWNCVCREINSSLIVIRRKNQICPFHAFIKYFLFHSEQKESASSSFESRYLLKHICSLLSLDSNNTIANCEPLCSQPLKLWNWTKLLFFFTHRKPVPSLCSN